MHTGIFYFVLGNLPPKFRSRLSAIHLVAIVNRNVLSQYGMDPVLRPFVDDLKKLVGMYMYITLGSSNDHTMYSCPCIKEHGYSIEVQGLRRTVYGTIAAVSADNLGSCALGGFKESATAHRMCRQCLATKEQARIEVGGATHRHMYGH